MIVTSAWNTSKPTGTVKKSGLSKGNKTDAQGGQLLKKLQVYETAQAYLYLSIETFHCIQKVTVPGFPLWVHAKSNFGESPITLSLKFRAPIPSSGTESTVLPQCLIDDVHHRQHFLVFPLPPSYLDTYGHPRHCHRIVNRVLALV